MTKKLLIAAIAGMMVLPLAARAQEFRVVPFYGYTIQDRVPTYEADIYVRDASQYGGILQILPNPYVAFSFMYKYSQPEVDLKSYNYFYDDIDNIKTNLSYYMFGVTRFMNGSDEKASPFGSFYLGWSTWAPQEDYSNFSVFSLGFDLGVSVRMTDNIGLNLRSELMLPINGFGSGIYCGTGSGCGASFSAYSSVTQLGFTGGVEIRLAPKEKASNSYTY